MSLYGNTAPVTMFDAQGVVIGLGTDWTPSGSMNMLRELRCAALLNAQYYNGYFTDEALWRMATTNNAVALSVDDVLGLLAEGLVADVAVFDGRDAANPYRAVIEANPEDVLLVLRGGLPLYGETSVVSAVPGGGTGCEPVPGGVCGASKTACVQREAGKSFAALASANAASYELFFCGDPEGEPSCVPARPLDEGYLGALTYDDRDGDGVRNEADNCPDVFNPARPLDGTFQADGDRDGDGDVCDPCPLTAGTDLCAFVDPDDNDGDGFVDDADNCPEEHNLDQANRDGDDRGDACDPCPDLADAPGGGCPATIYDVKTGVYRPGTFVVLQGVVTGVPFRGFFIQVPEADQDEALDAQFSGIYVFVPEANPQGHLRPAVGDLVEVAANVYDFYGQTELSFVRTVTLLATGTPVPLPVPVLPADVTTDGPLAEAYEGVLVSVDRVAVTSVTLPAGPGDADPNLEFEVGGALRVNDLFYVLGPYPEVGEVLSLVGILRYANGDSKLEPRSAEDVTYVTGAPPQLVSFAPSGMYLAEGTSGTTVPGALAVLLDRNAPAGGVEVGLLSADPDVVAVPASAIVPAGARSVPLGLSAGDIAGSGPVPVTLTATLGAAVLTAEVRVYDPTAPRVPVSLDPPAASVLTGATLTLSVTLDAPAPTGGQQVFVTATPATAVSVPESVVVPAGALSANIVVLAGGAPGDVHIDASVGATMVSATVRVTEEAVGPCLLISEYVEGTSNNKAVEIVNCGVAELPLAGHFLGFQQNDGPEYDASYAFSGTLAAGAVLAVCNPNADAALRDRCDTTSGSLTFNGDDRIALFRDVDGSGGFTAGDAVLDVFGQLGVRPASVVWAEHTYDRCNPAAFDGLTAFTATQYYAELPQNAFDGVGVAPALEGCAR